MRRRFDQWARNEEARLRRQGKTGPRYRRWSLGIVGVTAATLLLAGYVAPHSPLLGLLVLAVAFGSGIVVYHVTGTAWGWASHRLYERDQHPSAYKRNVVGLAVPLVCVLLLMGWLGVKALLGAV